MKTNIIITIGPKTETAEKIKELIEAGVNMFRFNFSHATYEQFVRVSKDIRKIAKALKKDIKIIQDLQGPRIRVGKLPDEGVVLKEGMEVGFTPGDNNPLLNLIKIDDKELYSDIKKGNQFFLANGDMELIVTHIKDRVIWCRVTKGGILFSHKAVNVPDTNLERSGLTPKDIKDMKFGLQNVEVDYIALSFVQVAEDVTRLKNLIKKIAGKDSGVKVISKIERGVALSDIDRIIVESDAIMFARGDLGVEVPVESLPIIQKNIIRHAHWHNTPTIIATQVLTSMINSSSPTRAEVSDISNAVFDHADAVMLSDETAVGNYSIEAVKMLKKVIVRTEEYLEQNNFFDAKVRPNLNNKYTNFNLSQ